MKDTVNKGDSFGFDAFKVMCLLGVIFPHLDVLDQCLVCESILSNLYY